jgi:hypothetical protein
MIYSIISFCGGWCLSHGIRHEERDIAVIGGILIGSGIYLSILV